MTLPSNHSVDRKLQIVPKSYWTFWMFLWLLGGVGSLVSALLSGEKRGVIFGVISLIHGVAWSIVYWRIKHEK
jgi:hypothetical protein